MDQKTLSPPQKKSGFSDADMMGAIQNKGSVNQTPEIQQAKERLLKVMQTSGISPQTVITAAKYASQALKDPKMYPIAIQMAIKEQLINPEDVQQGGVDYRLLASGITAGKMVQELMQEGKI
jgi:hypothetical protein